MPSIYCPHLIPDSKQIFVIDTEYHHLINVLRHKAGDEVRINNGKGLLAQGVVTGLSKRQAEITIHNLERYNEPKPAFAIAFSLLRNKNDLWLVEKVTELGVKDLFPLITRHSVRNPSSNTVTKFRQTAIAAIKQCDNPFLPIVNPVSELHLSIDIIRNFGYKILVASENRPDIKLTQLQLNEPYCFMIGPEGGFSKEEFDLFRENNLLEVSLSGLILRAETAAITAAAQFNLLN